MFEEGGIAGELMLGWITVACLNGSRYEGEGMEVFWTHRLMCNRSMGGECLRR